jgi:hypothetical protein
MLQVLFWVFLPRQWFPVAAFLVFVAHWLVIGYAEWDSAQLDKLPMCDAATPPGTKCIHSPDELDGVLAIPILMISSAVWLVLSLLVGWLRYALAYERTNKSV